MSTTRAILAARNNVAWCDAVCRSGYGNTTIRSGLWWNASPSPPYYPNVITAAPGVDFEQMAGVLQTLARDGAVIGVKDSFSNLDLSPSGFALLFDASWLWREPTPSPKQIAPRELQWSRVVSPTELERWEHEWRPDRGSDVAPGSIYGSSLLQAESISFVAAYAGTTLVAGAALTETEGTVGVACTFFRGPNPQQMREELVSFITEVHPDRPLVGYESGDDLASMKNLGFKEVGPLRVWLGSAAR